MRRTAGIVVLLLAPRAAVQAQNAVPIASVSTDGVTLTAPLAVANGRATIGNNGTVAAGDNTAELALARGGTVKLCATTTLHLAMDRSVEKRDSGAASAGLMLSLDRGAFEADYATGQYSDVILTPDLRILVSGPGHADLKLRVSRQGDTCIDNHASASGEAPYVTVSSMMEGGLYRVRAGQRVLFEHGSLQQVVDNEQESCGCPASASPASQAKVGGPSSTPADTTFPVAVSEGLAPQPAAPTAPVVPSGQAHAQVTADLGYEAGKPLPPPPPAVAAAPAAAPVHGAEAPAKKPGFFSRIGHFFGRIFGA